MKTLIYTFRTFPFKDKIPVLFIFGKLKEDFEIFSNLILNEKPEIIIGIAKNESFSCFEKQTINRFNKDKKISKHGKEFFELYIPTDSFAFSNKATDSFCNWTCYKIKEFIENNNLNIKLSFIHINEKDLDKLNKLLRILL